jgi:hypothetical protein
MGWPRDLPGSLRVIVIPTRYTGSRFRGVNLSLHRSRYRAPLRHPPGNEPSSLPSGLGSIAARRRSAGAAGAGGSEALQRSPGSCGRHSTSRPPPVQRFLNNAEKELQQPKAHSAQYPEAKLRRVSSAKGSACSHRLRSHRPVRTRIPFSG